MSEDYLTQDVKWDDEVGEVDESDFQPITEVGSMQYLGSKEVTAFASGATFTLPNVIINGQPWSRGGMREGHTPKGQKGEYERNTTAHFVLYELTNKDGNEYTTVEVLYTMATIPIEKNTLDRYPFVVLDKKQQEAMEKNGVAWLSHWSNFQFPAYRNGLPASVRDKFGKGEKVYYKAVVGLAGKGKPGTDQAGNAKTFYNKYRHTFQVFNTREEMVNARSQNGTSGGVTGTFYPASWTKTQNGVQSMLDHGKKIWEAGEFNGREVKTHSQLASVLSLDEKTETGEPCSAARIILQITGEDIPEPMVKL